MSNEIQELLQRILTRLEALDDAVFGPGGSVDPPGPPSSGGLSGDLNYLGILSFARRTFFESESVIANQNPGAFVFLDALSETIDKVAGAIDAGYETAMYTLAGKISDISHSLSPTYMSEIQFGPFLDYALEMGYQFENEDGRDRPLDFGEFCYCIGAALQTHLRRGLFDYISPFDGPGGLKKPESWGKLLGNVQSLLFSLARWFGCYRGPIIKYDNSGPVDLSNLPYSVGGSR